MKALVCDSCGTVVLLDENGKAEGVHTIYSGVDYRALTLKEEIHLCEKCYGGFTKALLEGWLKEECL